MENTRFCSEFQVGLAADQIVLRTVRVVAAQLQDRIRVLPVFGSGRPMGLRMPNRSVSSRGGVDLDGHAALEHL